jgi:signal transduction histidine kinase
MAVTRASLGATLLWAFTLASAALVVLLMAMRPSGAPRDDLFGGIGGAAFIVLALAFSTVGALIAARVPGNAVGRIFLAIGASSVAGLVAYGYATWGLARTPDASGTTLAVTAWNPISQPAAPLLGLALLLFPDGRLPSRRWWPAAASLWLALVLLEIGALFAPGRFETPFDALTNPLGLAGTRSLMLALAQIGWVLVIAGLAAGAASLVVRLHRATGDERQQLRLVLTVGSVLAVVATVTMATWFVWPDSGLRLRMAVVGLCFAGFAAAAGVAILRYRLYELDLAIDLTLVYAALTLLLGAAYALTALALGTALGSGSTLATAGATLVVAVAFRPLRALLQDLVDRRFRRARYDALRRIGAFLEELRAGRVSPEAIEPLLRELLGDPELELRFFLPESEVYVDGAGGPVADVAGDDRVRTPIERAGMPVALVLHRPTGPSRPDPLATLVEAGGLAIEIARLRVELRRQLAEVEASRARIVAAGNAERRRIERDLHDGAQQRLVSIGLVLRHAQHEPGPAAHEAIDRAVAELAEVIAELRELAHGLPPSQLDAGLEPALRELAGRAPLPVHVQACSERFSVGLEAAAYFIACEGLTNAIKHAQATSVVLSARRRNGTLVVRVADDGVGGAAERDGSGLRGLHDRVAAHGGRLRIESAHRAGTTLTAELPCVS